MKPKEEPLEVKPKEEPLDAEAEEEDQPAPTRSRPCGYRRLQLPGREDRPAPAGEDQPAATRYVEVRGRGGQWAKIVLAKEEADIDEGEPAMRRLRSSSRHRRGRAGDEAAYYVQPRRGHRRGRAGDEAAEVFQPIEELDECNEECRDEDSVAHTEASVATEAQRHHMEDYVQDPHRGQRRSEEEAGLDAEFIDGPWVDDEEEDRGQRAARGRDEAACQSRPEAA